ncbi:MAG: acyl-CoA dehydrogenase [Candidatus Thioglobus sp.]|nr:MAG: acyl-CoA dehydrogenase [Candidatus Thioglobus sp.]
MLVIYYVALVIGITVLFARVERSLPFFVIVFSVATLYLIIGLELSQIIIWVVGSILLLINLILFVPFFRLLLIKPIVSRFVNTTKLNISETEKVAMECGDTHWEKQLFTNQLYWNELLNVETKPLSAIEQDFIHKKVPQLCDTFNQFGLTDKTLDQIKSAGFWSLNIPKKYGGLDFSAQAHAKILTQLSSCNTSLAVTVMVPNSLGPAELILHYGTDEQKQDLLPKLATGEHIPCFALTSTNAGSDAGAMVDSGVICQQDYNGKNTLGILLNWDKRYTTLAPMATLIGLAFKTYDPDGLIGNQSDLGITCALVDSALDGVSIGRHHHPIGSNFSNGPHQGKDVFIPISAVIGGQAMIGQGWSMLMESLSLGRGVSLPSLSLAGVELSLKTSLEYALIRKQFKQSLYRFQGVAEKLVSMAADTLTMKAMSNFHLNLLDQGLNPSVSSAILKYHHTELLRTNINHAMDIHGGKTVMLGQRNYLSDIYQVVPIAITVEGANILTRSMIIFGQGLMRCHPFLKEELESLEKKDVVLFNQLLGHHLAHIIGVKIKSFVFAISGGRLAKIPKGVKGFEKNSYQQLATLSASFAFLVEIVLMKFGPKIKFQESINGLFSDLLIKMYSLSVLLKYRQALDNDFDDLIRWSVQRQVHQSQVLLSDICGQLNFSSVFRWIVLPRGVNRPLPSIKLQNKVVNQLVNNPNLKDALTSDVLHVKDSALDILDQAYTLAIQAEKIYKRVKYVDTPEAIDALLDQQQISTDEHQLLLHLTELRRIILAVDDYED